MIHRRYVIAFSGLVFCLSGAAAASAQSVGTPPATDVQGGGDLSDKLSKSDGVIHPKTNVDPGMGNAPADMGTARTPVIPPGSSGGPTDIQPK